MKTSTHRETASFTIEAGATRQKLISSFADATLDLENRAKEQGNASILWDMLIVAYEPEERDEVHSITGSVASESTWPARVVLTVPLVVIER